jgi:tetratricopeptide (TPR) repeat protein
LAEVVLVQGDSALATSLARESLTGLNAGEHPVWTAQALRVLGRAAYERGDLREARKLLEDARSLIPTGRSFHLDADFAELLAAQGEREQAQELLTTMVARLRDSGRPVALSHVRRIQGWDELRHGECREAMTSYRESLSLLQEQGVREGAPECLEELAGTLAARFGGAALAVDGQRAAQADKDDRSLEGCGRTAGARLAARLLGAAEALREAMGAPLPAVYQPDHERTIVCLRAALDEGEVAAAWAEGRAVSLSQAVAEALAAT